MGRGMAHAELNPRVQSSADGATVGSLLACSLAHLAVGRVRPQRKIQDAQRALLVPADAVVLLVKVCGGAQCVWGFRARFKDAECGIGWERQA